MLRICLIALALTPIVWLPVGIAKALADPSGGVSYAANMVVVAIVVLTALNVDARLNRR